MRYQKTSQRGFIALTSALIISVALLALAASMSLTSLFSRLDTLEKEYKRVSGSLAESCVSVALVRLAENSDYAGNEALYVDTDAQNFDEECFIDTISFVPANGYDESGRKTAAVVARAKYRTAVSAFRVSVDMRNPETSALPSSGVLQTGLYEEVIE